MKKFAAIILALTMVLALCACGGTTASPSGTPSNNTDTNTDKAGNTTPTGYLFTYNGVQFGVDIVADDVIAKLGDCKDKKTSESCAFGGEDSNYYYNGFEVSTNNENGYERIYSIYLNTDLVSTEEGICVGSTADAVKAAYGEPTANSTESTLIYEKDGMQLIFTLENGAVIAILYNDI